MIHSFSNIRICDELGKLIRYIGVGESDDAQFFYYFIKSESNPQKDPVLLWLTGGPGCSTLSALAFQMGKFYNYFFVTNLSFKF